MRVCVRVCVCVYKRLQLPDRRSHGLQILPTPQNLRSGICRYLARNSATLPNGGNRASSCFSWRKVWTGVKCNFSSAHHHVWKTVGKLSISRVLMGNSTGIRPKTKKLWLSIISPWRPSEEPGLGPPPKGVNCNFFSPEFDKPYGVWKLSNSDA